MDYKPKDRTSAYAFVRRTLARFDYGRLARAERGCLRACVGNLIGVEFSQAQRNVAATRARRR